MYKKSRVGLFSSGRLFMYRCYEKMFLRVYVRVRLWAVNMKIDLQSLSLGGVCDNCSALSYSEDLFPSYVCGTRVFACGENSHACRRLASGRRSARGNRTQVLPERAKRCVRSDSSRTKQKGHRLVWLLPTAIPRGDAPLGRNRGIRLWRKFPRLPSARERPPLCAGKPNPSFARTGKTLESKRQFADKTKRTPIGVLFVLAAEPGFEPRRTESESAVLPLHNSAMLFKAYRIIA